MRFNKTRGMFLAHVIGQWQNDGTVDPETAKRLRDSFAIRPFDWARLAKYSFIIAVVCGIISVTAMVADGFVFELFGWFFSAPDSVLCLVFAVMASAVFYLGQRRRLRNPEKIFSNGAILFTGALLTFLSIGYFSNFLDNEHSSLLILFAVLLYCVLGYSFKSRTIWTLALFTLGCWFGAATGYISGGGAYFFGMNYPFRFVLLGAALAAGSFLLNRFPKTAFLHNATFVIGLLYLFISLWILSIFGNYGENSWHQSSAMDLLFWSVLFGLVAVAAIWHGLKYDDPTSRGFGLTFLFINLYTKYFEYFWSGMHKGVFFLFLAVSFWLIGRRAEKIWSLEFIKRHGDGANGGGAVEEPGQMHE